MILLTIKLLFNLVALALLAMAGTFLIYPGKPRGYTDEDAP